METVYKLKNKNFPNYLDQSRERLLRLYNSERILPQYGGPVSTSCVLKHKKNQRHKQWKEKQLHGKFRRETEEVRSEETCVSIRKGYRKKETEGLIFAAQEQTLRTNWIRKNIDGQDVPDVEYVGKEIIQSLT